MTEQEWLACTDPAPMLGFLRRKNSDSFNSLFLTVTDFGGSLMLT